MFGQAYGAALVIVAASILLGRAICVVCGGTGRWHAAPLVGFAALMVLADAAIKLPGRADTAVVVCGVALVISVVFLVRRQSMLRSEAGRSRRMMRSAGGDLAVGGVALLGASIPFLASGEVGPGVGVDNDMAIHLLVAEALRTPRMEAIWNVLSAGYPTGPHSVVAAVGTAADLPLIMVFTGLLLAVVVLTALAAGDLLAAERLWRRVIIGCLCSLTYLVAAFYGEGAFKETIMAGLLLGFVVHLEQVRSRWPDATEGRRFGLVLPAGVLAAGAIYNYSYLGVVWFAGTLVVWLVAEAALQPRLARSWISRLNVAAAAQWAAGFVALGAIVLIPIAGNLETFFTSVGLSPAGSVIPAGTLGNLFHPLSAYESLGVWWSSDFRQDPVDVFHAGELSVLALAAVVFGFAWSVRRRQLVLPAAVAASGLIWLYANHSQAPYVAAKALVIASPVIMAIALRGLLTPWRGARSTQALVLTCAAAFCASGAYSSYRSLQNSPVQAPEAGRELAAFHHIMGDAKVLFLGIDDWAPWELRDSPVATLSDPTPTVGGAASPPNKPFVGGLPLDFNSVVSDDLNNFPYVITTNTSFASQPPPNFHRVASGRLYQLWRRIGPTPQYASIEPTGVPGAVLDCHSRIGRQLAASSGVASLMAQPLTFPGLQLAPGQATNVRLTLPAGRWELSIAYTSTVAMNFAGQGTRYTMPAYMGRPGAYFSVGSVVGDGSVSPITWRVSAERPSFLSGDTPYADIGTIAATRIPNVRRLVPLRRACGKYIDWFGLR